MQVLPIKPKKSINGSGFTLIELLIVVVILSTLASVVLPMFSNTTNNTHVGAASQSARILQSAIDRYHADHGFYPGPDTWGSLCPNFPSSWKAKTKGELLRNRLAMRTNASGVACDAKIDSNREQYPFGPYISKQLPINPINKSRQVLVTDSPPTTSADLSSYGWVYNYKSGDITSAIDFNTALAQNAKIAPNPAAAAPAPATSNTSSSTSSSTSKKYATGLKVLSK